MLIKDKLKGNFFIGIIAVDIFVGPLSQHVFRNFRITWQYVLDFSHLILNSNNLKHIQANTNQDKYRRSFQRDIL